MSIDAPTWTRQLMEYLSNINLPEHPILQEIRTHCTQHRLGKMAIAPQQAQLLTWLARLIGAKRYLEIGTFTGYSSTAMALALPDDAQLTCCDISVTFTDVAQHFWQKAGVAHKIDLHLQPALFTLQHLAQQGKMFDVVLIDADKPPTAHYYEACLPLVRSGGFIAIDNVLLNGRVAQESPSPAPPSLAVLQTFNASLRQDARIVPLTLPLGDGLTLMMKK